ncbi:MAG: hypothetical protein EP307_06440 [Rhodobacteraceae bacterium]|nr:MAG: hypothetical protein EP307_06440 [Paracoccaceae bacterium]
MKVIHNTPEQLIVEETPWLLGIMLIFFILCFVGPGLFLVFQGELMGLFFAAVGGGLGLMGLIVFVQRVQVILDGAGNRVILRRRTMLRYTQIEHALSDLSEARLDMTRGSKGGTLYRPVLIFDRGMSAGDHPIIEAYTSGRGPGRAVDAINGWLQATRALQGGRLGAAD